jgi:hypothetical protein
MNIRVINKAKDMKSQQIQSASKLVSDFVRTDSGFLKDGRIQLYPLSSLLKKIFKTYSNFFKDVENKREHMTLKLFIYLYRSICNKFSGDRSSQADENFKSFLKSLLKYQDQNSRTKLFSAFMGLKSNLDTDSFQLYYEIYRFIRDK